MIQDRWLTPEDYSTIELSLAGDHFHKDTKPEFFYEPGTMTKVYYDESGPIMFVRGKKSLRVDIQFTDNRDFERNRDAMKLNFKAFSDQCRSAGFGELVFNTDNPFLRRFCKKELGFQDVPGKELRYFL